MQPRRTAERCRGRTERESRSVGSGGCGPPQPNIAQEKSKDLTKYKIQFEQVELNDARSNFVTALLESYPSEQPKQKSKKRKCGFSREVGEDESHISKQDSHKKDSQLDGPIGFD